MANSFSSKIDIFFEDVLMGFGSLNLSAKNDSMYKPNVGNLAESGQTFYRPMEFMTEVVDGRDVSSSYKDLTELTVPSTLTDSHIRNVPISFLGVDLNNPHVYQRAVDAANVKLSNKVDTLVANEIAEKGTLAVISTGKIDTYDEAAEADALMLEQQATRGDRMMLLNPRMAKNLASDLANRQTLNSVNLSAYERSLLPPIAGFQTHRTDYGKTITGSAGTGYLVNGGSQGYTPLSKDGNGLPVDNRSQTLAVDTGTGAAVGDIFTIAGVNAVGHINKQSTGQLKTFRILAINGANWTISPPIIPANGSAQAQKDYANVTAQPADNAAITIKNIVTKASSIFFEKSAIEIIHADFDISSFRENGKKVRTGSTDTGLKISMISDSNIDTLQTKYRMFIWCNVTVLNPELAGVMLEEQT